jgi:Flp pilus assembly protein TadG
MRGRGDTGQEMAIEIMVLTPVVLMLLLAITWAGRYASSHARVSDVAGAAARAASLEDGPDAGRSAVDDSIVRSKLPTSCGDVTHTMTVNPPPEGQGAWRGGSVTVTVSCTIMNTALVGVWVPGSTMLTGTSTHPIDAFRAG